MKVFSSSGVVLILFAAGVTDLLLPAKSLAAFTFPVCVRGMIDRGWTALMSENVCSCVISNRSRFGHHELTAQYCIERYHAERAPRMQPSHGGGGGNIDLCSGANAALVRASGLDWCDPTIRVEPVLRPEWQF